MKKLLLFLFIFSTLQISIAMEKSLENLENQSSDLSIEPKKMDVDDSAGSLANKRKRESIQDSVEPEKFNSNEERPPKRAKSVPENSQNMDMSLQNQESNFDQLPPELIIHILSFLFDEPCLKSVQPVDQIENILFDKNICNALQVNKQWNLLIKDQSLRILNKIISDTKNKESLEKKFSDIYKKKELKKSDIQIFKLLLKNCIDINSPIKDSVDLVLMCTGNFKELPATINVFSLIVSRNHTELVKIILDHISNWSYESQKKIINDEDNIESSYYHMPLWKAGAYGYDEIVVLILNHIKNFKTEDQLHFLTAITAHPKGDSFSVYDLIRDRHYFKDAHDEIFKILLQRIDILDQNIQKKMFMNSNHTFELSAGETILIAAVDEGRKKVLKLILKHISNFKEQDQIDIIQATDWIGRTALIVAAERYFWTTISYQGILPCLMKKIKKFNQKAQVDIINAKDNEGNTPLITAVKNGNLETAVTFLRYIKRFSKEEQLSIIEAKDNSNHTALDWLTGNLQLESIPESLKRIANYFKKRLYHLKFK